MTPKSLSAGSDLDIEHVMAQIRAKTAIDAASTGSAVNLGAVTSAVEEGRKGIPEVADALKEQTAFNRLLADAQTALCTHLGRLQNEFASIEEELRTEIALVGKAGKDAGDTAANLARNMERIAGQVASALIQCGQLTETIRATAEDLRGQMATQLAALRDEHSRQIAEVQSQNAKANARQSETIRRALEEFQFQMDEKLRATVEQSSAQKEQLRSEIAALAESLQTAEAKRVGSDQEVHEALSRIEQDCRAISSAKAQLESRTEKRLSDWGEHLQSSQQETRDAMAATSARINAIELRVSEDLAEMKRGLDEHITTARSELHGNYATCAAQNQETLSHVGAVEVQIRASQEQRFADMKALVESQMERMRLEWHEAVDRSQSEIRGAVADAIGRVNLADQRISDGLAAAQQTAETHLADMRAEFRTEQQAITSSHKDIATHCEALQQEIPSIRETLTGHAKMVEKFDQTLDELRIRWMRADRSVHALRRDTVPETDGTGILSEGSPAAAKATAPIVEVPGEFPFDYFMFESKWRGSVAEIKNRQAMYLEFFVNRQKVLDLGCGRGEFVELLLEKGIDVTGVDLNDDMVDFCSDRGLPIVRADIFTYLSGIPDASLDAITAFQVVEHFSPPLIHRFLKLCQSKLRPGGLFIAETVNISCPGVLSSFFLDPTHIRPVPADLLKFMIDEIGLRTQCLRFSGPLPGISGPPHLDLDSGFAPDASKYQDYAAVAIRC